MKGPPPYLVRRLIWAPALVVGTFLLLTTLPLWIIVAAFASRFVPGRWRPLRVAWFLFVYLTLESIAIVLLFVVWIVSGFGWKLRTPAFQTLHYKFAGIWLGLVMTAARRTFSLKITNADDPTPSSDAPLLVFSRHAGPGDSFLLIDAVLNQANRQPRIILKDLLQVDPCVDILLNRVPSSFVPSYGQAGQAVVDSIVDLAAGMDRSGALVLFPEGGNFTPARRARAIEKLDEIGRPKLADQAREMQYLLPPKPTGALAAIEAAPTADVVFIGHAGLEQLSTMRDLWRGIPMDADVVVRLWPVPAADIPPESERERWLYDHWSAMDDWIGNQLNRQSAEP